ncbi:DNA-directed RNA polymerase subunit delta [Fictibacillus fluitans]|uniref:Probable DNA-directed RNA polymerase subunit delta n=1 Tax=Fictibacillus fluitans TaxID=3058422 RepID=A0ABT8HVH0_9BACL|nr:DNA-directed RNA polymerase subunit delta [Fictibacillus sp. NE201]MDN4524760.1 DNA-directed RNA polymerase subunit delta [Fictibacillus sp. NE201]
MSLIKTHSKEEIMEMAMVEIAFEILKEEKDTISFYDLVKRIKDLKGISEAAVQRRLAHFYTDMNIDGRFVSLGDNKWGLKAWYPIESSEEELGNTNKPTKRKKVVAEDEDFEDYDEDFEEEDFDALDADDEFAKASTDDDEDDDDDEDEDLDEDFDIADSDEELDDDIEDEEDKAAEEELYEVEEEDEEDR